VLDDPTIKKVAPTLNFSNVKIEISQKITKEAEFKEPAPALETAYGNRTSEEVFAPEPDVKPKRTRKPKEIK
jgi:hypothetical protein